MIKFPDAFIDYEVTSDMLKGIPIYLAAMHEHGAGFLKERLIFPILKFRLNKLRF